MEEYFLSLIRHEQRGPWAAMQRGALQIMSWVYGGAIRLRNRLYDWKWKKPHRPNVAVISIGNVTAGGTGKTPCVEYVARRLREWKKRAAILSRGYGGGNGPNDEALVLEENLPDVPHLQGADRSALARIAEIELESEVLVLDDGFQHRRLARDIDVVLIDAANPWGLGHLLPRGLLREPLSSLRRADLILLTRCDQAGAERLDKIKERLQKIAPHAPVAESIHEPALWLNSEGETRQISELTGRKVAAFCGIGNPDAFRKTLLETGMEIEAFRTFPDHHNYSPKDIDDLRRWARGQAKDCVVVTTQKDLVKVQLSQLGGRQLWALRIQLRVTSGREELDRLIKEALA